MVTNYYFKSNSNGQVKQHIRFPSAQHSKHHNRERLVLGPDSLLNVYILRNNALDYYITKILDEYTKPTVLYLGINYKHE